MWLLIVMMHVNAGVNLTLHDFESENQCREVLEIVKKTAGTGALGWLEYGECKHVDAPRRYR